jgi:hypothetical protein
VISSTLTYTSTEHAGSKAVTGRDRQTVPSLPPLAILAIACLLLAGCGTAGRRTAAAQDPAPQPAVTYAAYPVLDGSRRSGIAVVSLAQARSVLHSRARPIWVAVKAENPHAVLPDIDTAREVLHEGARRIWLSKSDRGGLCLLFFDPAFSPTPKTDHTVTASCGVAAELTRGLALTLQTGRGLGGERWLVVGLAPSGVSNVSIVLGDGSVRTARVDHNSYSTTVEGRATEVSFVRDGVRQNTTI